SNRRCGGHELTVEVDINATTSGCNRDVLPFIFHKRSGGIKTTAYAAYAVEVTSSNKETQLPVRRIENRHVSRKVSRKNPRCCSETRIVFWPCENRSRQINLIGSIETQGVTGFSRGYHGIADKCSVITES